MPYNLRLGPLAFISPLENVTKSLGDTIENVGAALVPAERRPRPLKLKLPVEGDPRLEADPKVYGDRLERQVEQLMENRRWLAQGLYLHWDVQSHLAAWVLVGAGDLTEQDPGIGFGMYELELGDVFVVGTPGTHKAGRRLDVADRRGGQVPRDSRGLLYSTAFASTPASDYLLVTPGDVTSIRFSSRLQRAENPTTARAGAGAGRRPYRVWDGAVDGEVVTYVPIPANTDADTLKAPALLDDFGSVKAWDQGNIGTAWTGANLATAAGQDYAPDVAFGWERLLGAPARYDRRLALENGLIRVRWLGMPGESNSATNGGLVFEWWDETVQRYVAEGRFAFCPANPTAGNDGIESTLIELTPERGVLEIRRDIYCLRAILQRGWTSVRLESYVDVRGDTPLARLDFDPAGAVNLMPLTTPVAAPYDWVRRIAIQRSGVPTRNLHFAPAAANYSFDAPASVFIGTGDGYGLSVAQYGQAVSINGDPNVVIVQVSAPFSSGAEGARSTVEATGKLSLVDARSIPVLVARA